MIGSNTYAALPMEFAAATPASGVTGTLVNCGLGQTKADCGASPPAGFVALILFSARS